MKKTIALFIICFITSFAAVAQSVAINNEGLTPHPSAILDIRSAGKGLLIPRMSEEDRNNIPSPAIGLTIYQTTGM
ncbi:MAG: hypothetical protein EOO13_15805, partial [Chitinophagaceae bacterium]